MIGTPEVIVLWVVIIAAFAFILTRGHGRRRR
jgi:hypothetical protein